jgi:hypothetical protein
MAGFEVPVHDDDLLAVLLRIESLLTATVNRGAEMADTLDDVRSNLQELNVDVDTALQALSDLRDAAENSGVDPAAKAEIMGLIDAQQARIANALNPEVPVDPNAPHVDNTLPGELGGGGGTTTPPA